MPLSASDLPDELKKHFLEQIRQQVGSTQYSQLVAKLGEDGLVDLALRALESTATAPEPSPWEKAGKDVKDVVVAWWWWVFSIYGSFGPLGGTAFILVGLLLVFLVAAIYRHWQGGLGTVGKTVGALACGVALIGVVAFSIRVAIPWLATGVRGWWGWLLGHF